MFLRSSSGLIWLWTKANALARTETRMLIALALLAFALLFFVHLASEIAEGDTTSFDRAILLALRSPGNPSAPVGPRWLLKAMLEITALGGGTVLTLMTAMVVLYLLAAKRPATAAFVTGAVLGGAVLSAILKNVFERPRPDLVAHLVGVSSASFPSGHALNSAVTYLTLASLLAKTQRSRAVRIYLIAIAIVLCVLIGCSRVYLGVHWPTDVIAGWCVGSMWALICSLLAEYFQRNRSLEQDGNETPPRS